MGLIWIFMALYHKYCQINLIYGCSGPRAKIYVQYWAKFQIFWKSSSKSCLLPSDFNSSSLITKPDLLALIQLMIDIGYMLGNQNIYTLPMSGIHLLGVICIWSQNFVQILSKILLILTPPLSFQKGVNLWKWGSEKDLN